MTYKFKEDLSIGGFVCFEYEYKQKEVLNSMGSRLANQMDNL